jgi:hypothetical protein
LHRVDGELLTTPVASPFVELPPRPKHWLKAREPLDFVLTMEERVFLRRHWIGLKPDMASRELCLLAQLAALPRVQQRAMLQVSGAQPWDEAVAKLASTAARPLLALAGHASALACIVRGVYGALVEQECSRDGRAVGTLHSRNLAVARAHYEGRARDLDLAQLGETLPALPSDLLDLLRQTQDWLRSNKPCVAGLWDVYRRAEWRRKRERARLPRTPSGIKRRAEWDADKHPAAAPLHYRWPNVHGLLSDLAGVGT